MRTFQTNQPVVVSIEVSQGGVHVIASDRTDAGVAVSPSDRSRPEDVDAARTTDVDLENGTLSIRGPRPRGLAAPLLGWKRHGSVEVTVQVPEMSSLRVDAGFADVRTDGRLDDVEVTSGAGDVRLDRSSGLRVHTGAGHVAVEEASGRAEIVTAGDITIGVVAGDADIKNLNGTTRIGRVGGTVEATSANGDVTIEDAGRDVTVETANGSIRIGLAEGPAARIDAATRFGRVHDDLSSGRDADPSAETVEVHARTQLGDIWIARVCAAEPRRTP
jgi:hypothetical protein